MGNRDVMTAEAAAARLLRKLFKPSMQLPFGLGREALAELYEVVLTAELYEGSYSLSCMKVLTELYEEYYVTMG